MTFTAGPKPAPPAKPVRAVDPLDPHGPLRTSYLRVVEDPDRVLCIAVSRADVRALEVSRALAPVHVAHEEELVERAAATIRYEFQGYERDPRPMHEIGEVCRFARLLDEESPALLYFLDRAQRAAFARCVREAAALAASPPAGALPPVEPAAAYRARKEAAVLGLGAAYGFDARGAWADLAADLADDVAAGLAADVDGELA